jgi:hypothetical protein
LIRVLALALMLSLAVGCAQVNTNGFRRYQGMRLPAARGIVVYDFEPTGRSIGLGDGLEGDSAGLSNEEMKNRREVGSALADVLAKELESRGILTSRRSGPLAVPEGLLAVGGQIVTVDEGSRAKRILIGFGSGRSRLSSVAQLYGNTDDGIADLWEYQNTAASGAKPGILTTLPIGIAVQGVTVLLLVVNGGLATMGELSSVTTANAKRMADELADAVVESLPRVTTQPSN